MLILLPPSEGKSTPMRGPALDLASLSFPSLQAPRERISRALVGLSMKRPKAAAAALGLGPTQAHEVERNAVLFTATCAAAVSVYTGVLYDALDASTLKAPARRRLDEHVAIASALFGLVRPSDVIPAYRLSADSALPRLAPLSRVWREPVSHVIAAHPGPILDLRSGAYVALGPIAPDAAERSIVGRVLVERNGRRSVVSHHNKATKGRLVRSLVEGTSMPTSLNGLLTALERAGYRIEVHEAAKRHQPERLDIIVDEV